MKTSRPSPRPAVPSARVAPAPAGPAPVQTPGGGGTHRLSTDPEVAFVFPCLNEATTIASCIRSARGVIAQRALKAEIIVADNGSSDGSERIARQEGARVVEASPRGYGSAVRAGIDAARAPLIVLADADGSYDIAESIPLLERVRAGADLAMGSRFGGRILPGAMPWKNRRIGNPVLSTLARVLFRLPVSDIHCGLRVFSAQAIRSLDLRTTGMEFATEMVVRAALNGRSMTEAPVTLHPDGRGRPSHLRPWRDGWRHLRFMLLLAPLWTLVGPGLLLMAAGALLQALLYFGEVRIGRVGLGIHSMMAAALAIVIGYQAVTAGIAARLYGIRAQLAAPSPSLARAARLITLERALLIGLSLIGAGVLLVALLLRDWGAAGFGPLDPLTSAPTMVVATTLIALGVQTALMSLFYSMLQTPVR